LSNGFTDACQKIFVTSPQWRAIKQLAGSDSNFPSNLQRKVCETVDEFFVDIIKIKGYVIQLFFYNESNKSERSAW